MIFFFLCLTYFTQCDNLWVHLYCSKWYYLILFNSSVIFHYRWYISHLLEKILESPLDSKEIKPVNPKGNQPWIFIGKANDGAKTPILWPPDAKSQLIGKDPDAGRDWGQEEKGVTEDEMIGWHHQLSGLEFEQTPGGSEGQGSLACCSLWGCK